MKFSLRLVFGYAYAHVHFFFLFKNISMYLYAAVILVDYNNLLFAKNKMRLNANNK